MIKDFNTNIEERAEASYILYAILKSRPDSITLQIKEDRESY